MGAFCDQPADSYTAEGFAKDDKIILIGDMIQPETRALYVMLRMGKITLDF